MAKKSEGSGIQQAAGLIRYFDEESEEVKPLAPRTRRERGATLECAGARLASEVFYGHLMTGFDTLCVRHEVRTSSHRQ